MVNVNLLKLFIRNEFFIFFKYKFGIKQYDHITVDCGFIITEFFTYIYLKLRYFYISCSIFSSFYVKVMLGGIKWETFIDFSIPHDILNSIKILFKI